MWMVDIIMNAVPRPDFSGSDFSGSDFSDSDSGDGREIGEPGPWNEMELKLSEEICIEGVMYPAPAAHMLAQASGQLLRDHDNNPRGDSRTTIYIEDDHIYRAGRWVVENLYPCDVEAFVATFLGKVRLEKPGMVRGLASDVWTIVIV